MRARESLSSEVSKRNIRGIGHTSRSVTTFTSREVLGPAGACGRHADTLQIPDAASPCR